ncbi:MAG: STAS domain-containing protein, partial [Candidatus Latescibacteria bacterium]|nr:STAS domain-containing protein [Candidatus Latescibacterota bacterium]
MKIKNSPQGDYSIVTCSGRIDSDNYSQAEAALTEIVDAGNHHLILNLSDLDYISSAGLRTLINLAKKIKYHNGTIAAALMKRDVREIFDIAGFHVLIPTYDTIEE